MPPRDIAPGELPDPDGSFAHPHRGIATFTYVLEGALNHADSTGGNSTVTAGGCLLLRCHRAQCSPVGATPGNPAGVRSQDLIVDYLTAENHRRATVLQMQRQSE